MVLHKVEMVKLGGATEKIKKDMKKITTREAIFTSHLLIEQRITRAEFLIVTHIFILALFFAEDLFHGIMAFGLVLAWGIPMMLFNRSRNYNWMEKKK